MTELKPCPFCGSEAELIVGRHTPTGNEYTPRCTNKSCPGRVTKKWLDRQQAVDAWNRRAESCKQS